MWFLSLFKYREINSRDPTEWPFISILIACYNEEKSIRRKITNMREVDYPKDRMEVIFIDGDSTDATIEILEKEICGSKSWFLVRSDNKGKINQLNAGLRQAKGQFIFNTDSDAILAVDVLKKLVQELLSDEKIFVVGAYCRPGPNAIKLEQYHWNSNNKARLVESRAESSSIVVAPCYGFRRGLLDQFPEDLIADDIYVAFLASCMDKKTIYCPEAVVIEERTPQTIREFMPHKFRKANAFLRTSLRFIYRLPDMSSLFKVIFITRIFQQMFLPWLLILWIILTGSLVTLRPEPRYDIAIFGTAWIILHFLICGLVYRFIRLPDIRKEPYGVFTMGFGLCLTMFILLATGISYPFHKPTSVYRRI